MAYHPEVANDEVTGLILKKATSLHSRVGPGLAESLYQELLCGDLREAGLDCEEEFEVEIKYKNKTISIGRADLWVEGTVVVELKVVSRTTDAHFNQLSRYGKAGDATRGLLLNFGDSVIRTRRWTNFKLIQQLLEEDDGVPEGLEWYVSGKENDAA